ncbi:MAG: AraD1 family protein [Spirosomataceae bacterium]
MMRIVQLVHHNKTRKIALVNEPNLLLINGYYTVFDLAKAVLEKGISLENFIEHQVGIDSINYEEVYAGQSDWRLLPAIDHPTDPRFCMVSGTGLTHKASAENREKMNQAQASNQQTDSMKMYQWGVEGGKPPKGQIGIQPEWFYKGNGSVLKAHNEALLLPNYGNDGGEEPELAAIYLNDKNGNPHRIGFAIGNEFSDHVMEKKNYLYLAPSKIRTCAIGPELVLTSKIDDIQGNVSIQRGGKTLWEKAIKTGEANMSHSLENLEYHHFKYENHRIAYDVHVHFLGTGAFSFGENIVLQDDDLMTVSWEGMGRSLKNRLHIEENTAKMFHISPL